MKYCHTGVGRYPYLTWTPAFAGVTALLLLTTCAPSGKDYDASAKCQSLGYKPGTLAYDNCIRDEQAEELLKQQRREMEQMQRDRQDQKLRQY